MDSGERQRVKEGGRERVREREKRGESFPGNLADLVSSASVSMHMNTFEQILNHSSVGRIDSGL